MLKFVGLILVIALVNAEDMMETTKMIKLDTTEMPMESTEMMMTTTDNQEEEEEGELPCLNKAVGATMPHPGDVHKFLRCVSFDTLWVEACPSNLVYNQWLGLCDWNNDKPTTAMPTTESMFTTERVYNKNEPRLIKGFDWLKQLTSTWAPAVKTTTEQKRLLFQEITTTPARMIETETMTPEIIEEKQVKLATTDKIKMIETTPMMMTTEQTPVETQTAFIETDGLWMNPESFTTEMTDKVAVPKGTLEKMQRMFHKTV